MTDLLAEATRARSAEARRYGGALAVASLMHVALIAAMLASWSRDSVGSAGQSLEAISVEISLVPANGLAALRPEIPGHDAPQAPATPEPAVAKPDPQPPTPDARPPDPEPVVKATPDPIPPEPDRDALEATRQTTPEPPPEPREEAKPTPEPAREPREAPPRAAAIAAPPPVAAQAPQASARPSPGAVQAFARSVVAALAETRPKTAPGSARGTVRIAFSIAEAGSLESVRVAQSSGQTSLDQVALNAVRRASFKAPPPGMTAAERSFEIPYHFR